MSKQGRVIRNGLVYRRIKNDPTHFDFDTGRPDLAAFIPRPQDKGALSADLNVDVMMASLERVQHAGFGLCQLDIARMAAETDGKVWVEYAPSGSPTHVRIHGCADPVAQAVLADLAEIIRPPTR